MADPSDGPPKADLDTLLSDDTPPVDRGMDSGGPTEQSVSGATVEVPGVLTEQDARLSEASREGGGNADASEGGLRSQTDPGGTGVGSGDGVAGGTPGGRGGEQGRDMWASPNGDEPGESVDPGALKLPSGSAEMLDKGNTRPLRSVSSGDIQKANDKGTADLGTASERRADNGSGGGGANGQRASSTCASPRMPGDPAAEMVVVTPKVERPHTHRESGASSSGKSHKGEASGKSFETVGGEDSSFKSPPCIPVHPTPSLEGQLVHSAPPSSLGGEVQEDGKRLRLEVQNSFSMASSLYGPATPDSANVSHKSNASRPKVSLSSFSPKVDFAGLTSDSNRSLMVFSVEHPFRKLCAKIIESSYFDRVVLLVIVVNAIFIAMELELVDTSDKTNVDPNQEMFNISELIFTCFYSVEFVMKVVHTGFFVGKGTYLRDSWNWLDFVVLLGSYLGLLIENVTNEGNVGVLVLLRMIRIMRMLRTLALFPELRMLINTLFRAMPSMARIATMFTLLMVVFGTLGLQLFAGKLRGKCVLDADVARLGDIEDVETRGDLYRRFESVYAGNWTEKIDVLEDRTCSNCPEGYQCMNLWNPYHDQLSFDHFGYSVVTVFVVITGEGWADSMYRIVDATTWWATLFFVSLVLCGTNLIINLLLAVIKESFSTSVTQSDRKQKGNKARQLQLHMAKDAAGSTSRLKRVYSLRHWFTEKWEQVMDWAYEYMGSHPAAVEGGRALRRGGAALADAFKVFVESSAFNWVTMGATLCNTVILSIRHADMSKDLADKLNDAGDVMLVIFWAESLAKLIAYNTTFHRSGFDVFDLVVNIGSLLDKVLQESIKGVTALRNLRITRVVRTIRVLRVLKMARYLQALRTAVKVLASRLSLVANVILLLTIALFVFAVLGMFLFKEFYINTPADDLIVPRANFKSFYWACMSMFQALTLEGWTGQMYDAMSHNALAGSLFFIIWVLIGAYILLSLMMSIILDKFERDFKEHQLMEKRVRERKQKASMAAKKGEELAPIKLGGGAVKVSDLPALLDAMGVHDQLAEKLEALKSRANILPEDDEVSLDKLVAALPGSQIVSPERSQELRAVYAMWLVFDTDQSGMLSVGEVSQMIESMSQSAMSTSNGLTEAQRILLMEALCQKTVNAAQMTDTRRARIENTLVPFFHFLKTLLMLKEHPELGANFDQLFGAKKIDYFREQFRKFDKEESGYIDSSELKAFLESIGQEFTDWEVQQLMIELDVDNSGEIGFSEFVRGMARITENTAMGAGSREVARDVQSAIHEKRMAMGGGGPGGSARASGGAPGGGLGTPGGLQAGALALKKMIGGGTSESELEDDDMRGSDSITDEAVSSLRSNATLPTPSDGDLVTPPPISREEDLREFSPPSGADGKAAAGLPGAAPEEVEEKSAVAQFLSTSGQGNLRRDRWSLGLAYGSSASSVTPMAKPAGGGKSPRDSAGVVGAVSGAVEDAAGSLRAFVAGGGGEANQPGRSNKVVPEGPAPAPDGRPSISQMPLDGKSLGLIPATHPLRVHLKALLNARYFEGTLLVLIIVSSCMLAAEDPSWDETPTAFAILDLVFTIIFTLEVSIKMLVYGVIASKSAYLRDGWNVLDAFVVLCSLVTLIATGADLGFLRAVRLVRTLRPLRAISRRPHARRAFNTLLLAIPSFLSVSLIVGFIIVVFGIMSLDLFANGLHRCTSGGIYVEPPGGGALDKAACLASGYRWVEDGWFCWDPHGNFSEAGSGNMTSWVHLGVEGDLNDWEACDAAGYRWVDSIINFNNLGNACATLFIVITGEGWVEIMNQAVDIGEPIDSNYTAVPRNGSVQENRSNLNAMFFVVFITFVSFFLMDMFGGAVYTYYMESKAKEEGLHVLTEAQKKWKATQDELRKSIASVKKPKRKTAQQNKWSAVVESKTFNTVVTLLVILQVLLMFTHHVDEPFALSLVLDVFDYFMACALAVELLIKSFAEGWKQIFKSAWDRFDLVILVMCLIDVVFGFLFYFGDIRGSSPSGVTTLRLLRLGRFFRSFLSMSRQDRGLMERLAASINKLQIILETFLESMNSLLDIGLLLIVFYFIFGVVGMNLFGALGAPGMNLNSDANFTNVFKAVLTLFRFSTGEDWQALYEDIVFFDCAPDTRVWRPESCSTAVPLVFFVSFYLLMVIMIINLFIAIIIENFANVVSREYSAMGMEHVRIWVDEWCKRCTYDDTGPYLTVAQFNSFMKEIPEPLGVGAKANTGELLERINQLQLSVVEGKLYLGDTLEKVVRRVGSITNPTMGDGKKGPTLSDKFLDKSYFTIFDVDEHRKKRASLSHVVENEEADSSGNGAGAEVVEGAEGGGGRGAGASAG